MSKVNIKIEGISYQVDAGLTILEAHRLCKPVIATKTMGGFKTIENEVNGVLCEITAQAVAGTVEKFFKDNIFYNKIKQNLACVDYNDEFRRYREQWCELLEL